MTYIFRHAGRIGELAFEHIVLVGVALVIALVVALPFGVIAARNQRVATPLLGTLGAIYTIPSLALLAVLVKWIGLGAGAALVALVAYAQFVLVRNIALGLRGVGEAQRDAARGLGMTARQSLLRVEFPLALPTIVAGARIATVSMIAIATLAAYVDADDLGTLIFEGIAFKQYGRTIAGSLCAMALAIVADALLRGLEKRVVFHRPK